MSRMVSVESQVSNSAKMYGNDVSESESTRRENHFISFKTIKWWLLYLAYVPLCIHFLWFSDSFPHFAFEWVQHFPSLFQRAVAHVLSQRSRFFLSSFHLPLHVLISQCMFISCCCAMVSPIFPFFSAYHTCYHSENKRRWENLHQFFIVSTSHAHLEKESGEKGVQINLIDVMIKITSVFVVFVWIGRCLSVLATDAILPFDSVDAGNNSAKMRWNARRRKKKNKWKDRKRCWCRPENK